MADQRDHGVDGLEWRGRPAGEPDDPRYPSAPDAVGTHRDEVVPGEHAGDQDPGNPDGTNGSGAANGAGRTAHAVAVDAEDTDEGPLDMSALRADDELLSAIGSFDHAGGATDRDPALTALLMSWRMDVDAESIGELVAPDLAVEAIADGRRTRRSRQRLRYLVPVASAAAVLVVVFSGMGLAARDAQPGDALWGLSQVLYSGHARSVEAAVAVRTELDHAASAFHQGHLGEARTALAQAQNSLPSVANEDGKAALQQQGQTLLQQINGTTGPVPVATTSPGSPTRSTPTTVSTTAPPPSSTTAPVSSTTSSPPPSTSSSPSPPTSVSPPSITPQSSSVGQAPGPPSGAGTGQAQQGTAAGVGAGTPSVGTPTSTG